MSSPNETNREDPHGIARLRVAIEDVATEIEARQIEAPVLRTGGKLRLALGTAAVLIILLVGSWWIIQPRTSEVEVLMLRVHGRDVRARIVDDTAPGTIIVIPQQRSAPPAGAAAGVAIGGAI